MVKRQRQTARLHLAAQIMPKGKPPVKVSVNRQGSPTKHKPAKFTKQGRCLWCKKGSMVTGCGHANCGHLHPGECWKNWHSSAAHAVRDRELGRTKTKRKQPEALPDMPAPKRLFKGSSGGRFASRDAE